MESDVWVVYLVRCCDGSLYCGATNDLEKRLAAHNSGKGAKYTRSRRPVKLVAASIEMTKSAALKLEYRVKRVSAGKKIAELGKGKKERKTTTPLAKELMSVHRQIKGLLAKIETIIGAVHGDS